MAYLKKSVLDLIKTKATNGDERAKKLLLNLPSLDSSSLQKEVNELTPREERGIDFLIDDELEAIKGYEKEKSKLSIDKADIKKIYDFIINEEQKHIKYLKLIKEQDIESVLKLIKGEE